MKIIDNFKIKYEESKDSFKKSVQKKINQMLRSLGESTINRSINYYLKKLNDILSGLNEFRDLENKMRKLKISKEDIIRRKALIQKNNKKVEVYGTAELELSNTAWKDINHELQNINTEIQELESKMKILKNKFAIKGDYMETFENKLEEIINTIKQKIEDLSSNELALG